MDPVLPETTKTDIKRAAVAAEELKLLLEERVERHKSNKDKSRRFFEADSARLDKSITVAAVTLGKAASELRDQLRQPLNREYWIKWPRHREREEEKLEKYKITLRALCDEGLLSETRLAYEDKNISILDTDYDEQVRDYDEQVRDYDQQLKNHT